MASSDRRDVSASYLDSCGSPPTCSNSAVDGIETGRVRFN